MHFTPIGAKARDASRRFLSVATADEPRRDKPIMNLRHSNDESGAGHSLK
jgi:hypothetical protein